MTVRTLLKMGDPRLLQQARPVTEFDTPVLHQLIADMQDTMAAASGAGSSDVSLLIISTSSVGSPSVHWNGENYLLEQSGQWPVL